MKNDNTKPSGNRQKKEAIVGELAAKVERAKAMIFTNYQGLTHHQIEGLKKVLKTVDADFTVTKNSLMARALADHNLKSEDKDAFTKPTATLFMYNDIVEPLRHVSKLIKELQLPVVKFGVVEGRFVSDTDVMRLATLPPLPVLHAQLLGQMLSPVQGLHRALSWNLQSFVMILNAIKEKKAAA